MAATIETYALPTLLYRFRPLGDVAREVSALNNGQIWCGEYHQLNDAMEGLYEAGASVRDQPAWRAARDLIRYRKSSIGIACFCEDWNNALMWAHYAGSFTGICIEYDFNELRRSLPDQSAFARVSYADRLLQIGPDLGQVETLAKWILSTKHHSWAYEREWRLFAPTQGLVHGVKPAIRRVILGPRIERGKAAQIRAASGPHQVCESRVEGYNIELALT